jgi:sigma-B regulation protein RsbU (phosphoserine phosphatase)
MAVTRTLLRSVADREGSPADFICALNKSLSINNESCMFVTFFVGVLDLGTGDVVYANAGHNPPVVVRRNGDVEDLEMDRAVPVGVFEDYLFKDFSVRLAEGDKIFMYTDGVTEAENGAGEFYTVERLMSRLAKNSPDLPEALIQAVGQDVTHHVGACPQSDDITMMSIIYFGENRDALTGDRRG